EEAWDPRVQEHGESGDAEEPEAGPLARQKLFVLVEGAEESDLDQVGGPDHGSGVDEVATEDTGHTVSQHLGAEDKEQIGQEAKVFVIKDLLDDYNIDGVGGTSST